MAKTFLTFDQLIAYLEDEKQLLVSDHEYAKSMLKRIGYFGLISGYKRHSRIQLLRNTEQVHRLKILLRYTSSMKT